MKLLIALSFLVASSLLGCVRSITADDLSGVWFSKESGHESREINLANDGKFEVKSFPAALACSESDAIGDVDGGGTWEYESEDDRIFLKFTRLTDEKCATPYGLMIFRQPGGSLSVFLDVEKPSSAIVFRRSSLHHSD